MSCGTDGLNCETPRRRAAWIVLTIMLLIFAMLSWFSFVKSRGQVIPDTVSYGLYSADAGKRVFQAFNCMGCHTMVGNGAYLGPDLTHEYASVGPAWLAAFLPSAGGWPTEMAVKMQLQDTAQLAATHADTIDAYYKKFPGAKKRIDRRGGSSSLMPNLPFSKEQIGELIAYLRYTSEMNTEGWPPRVEIEASNKRLQQISGMTDVAVASTSIAPAPMPAPASAANGDLATHGAQLAKNYGCIACHSAGTNRVVGPGWGGLYGSSITLADGKKVKADDAYLIESVREPNAKVVAGFPSGVMPAYSNAQLNDDDLKAIVAYLHSLGKNDAH
jgi:mono/diheme cytochrome c family protein